MISLRPETIEKIDKLVPRYPTVRSAALPLCHLVQEDLGYLSNESIEWIAERLELQPINIQDWLLSTPCSEPNRRASIMFAFAGRYHAPSRGLIKPVEASKKSLIVKLATLAKTA